MIFEITTVFHCKTFNHTTHIWKELSNLLDVASRAVLTSDQWFSTTFPPVWSESYRQFRQMLCKCCDGRYFLIYMHRGRLEFLTAVVDAITNCMSTCEDFVQLVLVFLLYMSLNMNSFNCFYQLNAVFGWDSRVPWHPGSSNLEIFFQVPHHKKTLKTTALDIHIN